MEFKEFYESLCKLVGTREDRSVLQKAHVNLGKPGDSLNIVHVTGTNGKGTVSLNVARGLEKSGLRVGLFISPHYERINERISINGVEILDSEMEEIYQAHKEIFHTLTFFEYLTLTAFVYFKNKQVDVCVIEVGIGGLHDPTNIVSSNVAVITSIGVDHELFLGGTRDSVAMHKAGIIEEGKPVIIGPKADHPTIHQVAKEKHATLYQVEGEFKCYLDENIAIANKVLEVMDFKPIEKPYILPARFEVHGNVVFDMAHNVAAFKALKKKMTKHFLGKKITALVNMSPQKRVPECLKVLQSFVDDIFFYPSDKERLLTKKEAKEYGLKEYQGEPSDIFLVCGSVYIMKEAKEKMLSQMP